MSAMIAVEDEKERYLDSQIGKTKEVTSGKQSLLNTRAALQLIARRETSDFFKGVLSATKPRESEKP